MSDGTTPTRKKRLFSGMQPSGEAHLGNYLGALKRWVEMQDEYDCIWCIVDDHAITSGLDPKELPGNVFDLAVSFLAVGLDPERATIFVQSDVHEHTELAWLFNAVTPVGDLERMTQYKDKAQRFESVPAGILNYPILQAADILVYKADAVPVGEDQRQHLELAREVARKFNARLRGDLPGARGAHRRGRQDPGPGRRRQDEQVAGQHRGHPGRARRGVGAGAHRGHRPPAGAPHRSGSPRGLQRLQPAQVLRRRRRPWRTSPRSAGGARAGAWTARRSSRTTSPTAFAPFRERAAHYRAHPEEVRGILDEGAEKARAIAAATLAEVRRQMGLRWRDALD